ncbi:MAG: nuclear transport factor 2 family protein, partial [Planctomycetota bacterium]
MRLVLYFVLSSCCFGLTSPLANGEDAAVATGDAVTDSNAPISATINAYVAAFNARDVDALVALWSPEGVYVSRTSGEQLTGRDAIAADFAAIFALENPPTLAVDTESIEF